MPKRPNPRPCFKLRLAVCQFAPSFGWRCRALGSCLVCDGSHTTNRYFSIWCSREALDFYKYETVLSFGAPVANKYKIVVDGVGSMLFETNMVRGPALRATEMLGPAAVPGASRRYCDLTFQHCNAARQVLEIAKLMKEYIREIVTRRR